MRGFEVFLAGYLVNAIWQVPLWAAVVALVVRLTPSLKARHGFLGAALVMEVIAPAMPLSRLQFAASALAFRDWIAHLLDRPLSLTGQVRVAMMAGTVGDAHDLLLSRYALHAISAGFAVVLLIAVVRLVHGLLVIARLTRDARPLGSRTTPWGELRMAASARVGGPFLVGWRRPLLLVPEGFLESLDPAEQAALLAHEAVHAYRQDFVRNLAASIVSLPICFHPAMWWTRAQLTETREMICDQEAAARFSPEGGVGYARSLIRLASVLASTRPARPLHAIGFADANTLERRVAMLMRKQSKWIGVRGLAAALAFGALMGANLWARDLGVRVGAQQEGGAAPMTVASGIMAGNTLTKVQPIYPPDAKADPLNGAVILDAVIGKDGSIESLRVKQGLREDYDRSALDAVRQWKYQPYLLNGVPTEVSTTITITYSFGG